MKFLSTPGAPANEPLRTATLRLAVRWVDEAQIAAMFDQLQYVRPGDLSSLALNLSLILIDTISTLLGL